MKLSQNKRIENRLLQTGFVTRNLALKNYITRLSARIKDLQEMGWEFETKEENGDYIYQVKRSPYANLSH